MKKKLNSHEIDGEYFDLLKQSLILQYFSGLFREFDQGIQEFIDRLERYCPELEDCDVAEAKTILTALKSSTVKKEAEAAVEKLANMEMLKVTGKLSGYLPKQIEAGKSAMKLSALDDPGRFASHQSGRFFCDDFFNELVLNGKLGSLFSDNYFKSDKRNENLMQMLENGAELTATLVRISKKIRSLVAAISDE
ncbi:hypothetical protein [Endozoicomonas sp. ONNA2]|uniref:hypothetical protein n=1 Tax=Endozoicomonas sp. ONNA2 TaxID=2828741 RepID=UPI002148148B|nr:hypothetical protein [Endozoicomonas sp. ONNA2]